MTYMVDASRIFMRFLKGFRKTAVFAITTRCNCRCMMCDMYKKPPRSISFEDARKVLDFLYENKFLIVYFTGGEPTLHPDVTDIVKYANDLGFVTAMTTNGTVSKDTLVKLKEAGLYLLSVSFDHWEPEICEKIRRHKGIKDKQERTIRLCKEIGLRTHTLTFLNSYVLRDGVERLIEYVNEKLGVPFGFCYPVKTNSSFYSLGQNLSEEEVSYRNLEKTLRTILKLKKEGKAIANLTTYIEDIIRFHENKPPNFYCKGGEGVFYVDWEGNVYPCFVKDKLFNILKGEKPRFLKNVRCNDCFTNCFREPSILTQGSLNLSLLKEVFHSYKTKGLFL